MNGRRVGFADFPTVASSRARVLVVDDQELMRNTVARAVRALGHDVQPAPSAEAADLQLESSQFDLLLLDIEMRGMSGLEFLPWALKRAPEMPVIMLTGVLDAKVARQALNAGARNYLVKPIDVDFLELAIRDALAVRAVLQERNRLVALED